MNHSHYVLQSFFPLRNLKLLKARTITTSNISIFQYKNLTVNFDDKLVVYYTGKLFVGLQQKWYKIAPQTS